MMHQATSLFRASKTRNARTQEQLKSSLLVYKRPPQNSENRESRYHQTYDVDLPQASVRLLEPIVRSLSGDRRDVDPSRRLLFTVGMWREGTQHIYRCCFVQPEIASATCSFPVVRKPEVVLSLESVCEALPDATPCTVSKAKNFPQISGRMTPYVVENLSFEVSWGFANICRSRFLFISTAAEEQLLLTLSRSCIDILKPYVPDYGACVFDAKTSSYKITVRPDPKDNMNEPNKNTCMYIYGDGSFSLLGKPSRMPRVCECFRDALASVSVSPSWSRFVNRLVAVDQDNR